MTDATDKNFLPFFIPSPELVGEFQRIVHGGMLERWMRNRRGATYDYATSEDLLSSSVEDALLGFFSTLASSQGQPRNDLRIDDTESRVLALAIDERLPIRERVGPRAVLSFRLVDELRGQLEGGAVLAIDDYAVTYSNSQWRAQFVAPLRL